MRLIFFGTPAFALPSLRTLVNAGHEVAAVVTQIDKPQGRGKQMAAPPVKELAQSLGLPVFQPVQIREPQFVHELKMLEAEAIVVVSYGKILPQAILDLPRYGGINLHPSLLPKYRGAAPVPRPILQGDVETGVTTFQMDKGMDTGPILYQQQIPIGPFATAGMMYERLSEDGALLLAETLVGLGKGSLVPVPQLEKGGSYAPKLQKTDGLIDWGKRAVQIHNQVRGMNPWPGAYTFLRKKMLKVWSTCILDRNYSRGKASGEVLVAEKKGITVRTGEGELLIRELQPENRRQMTAEEYLAGHPLVPGTMLGDGRRTRSEG